MDISLYRRDKRSQELEAGKEVGFRPRPVSCPVVLFFLRGKGWETKTSKDASETHEQLCGAM